MKVAIIDNTCNNGYVLMRYFNDRGIDTDLLLLGKVEGHADPGNDTFNNQYFDKIIDTGWSEKGLLWLTKKEIKKIIDKYDFVIGGDYAPALFYRIGRKLDIFQPHGTDLFNYPFSKLNAFNKKAIGEWVLAYWQRSGIRNYCKYFMFELTNDENERYINYFKNGKFERIFKTAPFVYYPQYTEQAAIDFAKQNDKAKLLNKLSDEGYTIVFHHCQQQWKNPVHYLFNKGNDKLILGLKKFIDAYPETKIKLVMIERGTDIETSKKLIADLGIKDNVLWFPQMPRREIMACLKFAHIGVGELAHSWFTYSVVTEFMVMGVPIIHHCDTNYYSTIHKSLYPMFSANSSEDIYRLLEDYFSSPESFKKVGLGAQEWWRRNLLHDSLDYFVELLNKVDRPE